MKTFLFLFSFIAIITTNVQNTELERFDEEVEKAYADYVEIESLSNQYYTIKVVQGIIGNDVYSGIYFKSTVGKKYSPVFVSGNASYTLPSNKRGDVFCVAIKNTEYNIVILNSDGIAQSPNPLASIKKLSKEDFKNTHHVLLQGQDTGSKVVKLTKEYDIFKIAFLAIAAAIISICSIIIFIYAKKKKGMFAVDKRKEGTFNFKEFINEVITEQQPAKNLYYYDEEEDNNETKPKYKNEYAYTKNIDEELSGFDIKGYLRDKGFNTNYHLLSEDEKNKIMLELMLLKDTSRINTDDYYKETRELWKD